MANVLDTYSSKPILGQDIISEPLRISHFSEVENQLHVCYQQASELAEHRISRIVPLCTLVV